MSYEQVPKPPRGGWEDPLPRPLDGARPATPRLPTGARVVAWLFIAFGVVSAVDFLIDLRNGDRRLNLNVGFVGIVIGIGLLRRSLLSQIFAFIALTVGIAVAGIILALILVGSGEPTINFAGFHARGSQSVRVAVIAVALALILAQTWAGWVLTRPAAREAFT